jgi:hypothetical protein
VIMRLPRSEGFRYRGTVQPPPRVKERAWYRHASYAGAEEVMFVRKTEPEQKLTTAVL